MRRSALRLRAGLAIALFALFLAWAAPALAYNENSGAINQFTPANDSLVRVSCWSCHGPEYEAGTPLPQGVHVGFLTTTNKCAQCHVLHDADSSLLLAGTTVTSSCHMCHDGTGGGGVYGTVFARTLVQPQAQHRTEVTRTILGGDANSGGSLDGAFHGVGQNLTCSDCHSPHGRNTVAAFKGDRARHSGSMENPVSSKLLRQKPGDSATAILEYGSNWCLACHAGRASTLPLTHNHPVETTATADPELPYVYRNLPILSGFTPTSTTVIGGLGDSNRGYLMPFPRTTDPGGQDGHAPICQQCHEDSRNVGTMSDLGVGTAALFFVSTYDPAAPAATDNPRIQNFPHEGVNARFLVEPEDDLCINCHSQAQLD